MRSTSSLNRSIVTRDARVAPRRPRREHARASSANGGATKPFRVLEFESQPGASRRNLKANVRLK